jgi:hypothetical protein
MRTAGGGARNEKLKKVDSSRLGGLIIAILTLAAVFAILCAAAKFRPELVERLYRPFSRFVLYWLAYAFSFVPFSAAEILLYLAVALCFVAVVRLVYVLITGPRRLLYFTRFVLWAVIVAEIFGLVFYAFWGLNYQAEPLSATLALDVRARDKAELVALNEYLVEKANAYAELIPRGEDGYPEEIGFTKLAAKVAECFGEYTGRKELPAKYVLASRLLSYTGITGIFIPYTGEANVNADNVCSDLPFCIAHEMSHRYVVAPEDEANFFAFYILRGASDPYLAYSAYLAAIRYCQNALYDTDYEAFARIYSMYSDNMRKDLMQYKTHWEKYDGRLADVSAAVNDEYLKLQGEEDGVGSYDRMVDLMLAWYAEGGAK